MMKFLRQSKIHAYMHMLSFPFCLKTIGHLEALELGLTRIKRRILKVLVLSLFNSRMINTQHKLDYEILNALACLKRYEVCV